LLGALQRRAPEAIDWERLTAAGVVADLDAFEAAGKHAGIDRCGTGPS